MFVSKNCAATNMTYHDHLDTRWPLKIFYKTSTSNPFFHMVVSPSLPRLFHPPRQLLVPARELEIVANLSDEILNRWIWKWTGVIKLPTQTMHYAEKIPQNHHAFALFDPLKMGNLTTPDGWGWKTKRSDPFGRPNTLNRPNFSKYPPRETRKHIPANGKFGKSSSAKNAKRDI